MITLVAFQFFYRYTVVLDKLDEETIDAGVLR